MSQMPPCLRLLSASPPPTGWRPSVPNALRETHLTDVTLAPYYSHATLSRDKKGNKMETTTEDIKQLKLELHNEEQHLRDDLTSIKRKIEAARAELSPSKLIQQRLLPISGLAVAAGFALGSRGY